MSILLEELKEALEQALNPSSKDGHSIERNRYNPHLGTINLNPTVDLDSSESKLIHYIACNYLLKGYNILKYDGLILASNHNEELLIELRKNKQQHVKVSVSRNHLFDFTI